MSLKKIAYVLCMLVGIGQLHAQNKNEAVGTPQGSLSVSESGAAVYSVSIDAPNGGPLTPQIGLAYNSQMNGYGLAGYGVNLTGLSVITRGGKDMFHDKELKGVTYTESDNFYLDGKRLILKSGTQGKDGSVYVLEGNPFTEVRMHVPSSTGIWFDVTDNAGMSYQYGNTSDSRLSFVNTSGATVIASWYVNQTQDKYSNLVTYKYTTSDYCVRPVYIEYGRNSKNSRGIVNRIEFEYKSLGTNSRPFALANRQGKIGYCLSAITTSTTKSSVKNIYRKYTLTYDSTSDQSTGKWTRLTKVDEENGNGERLAPNNLYWEYLKKQDNSRLLLDIPQKESRPLRSEEDSYYFASDVNGDGISDIIRVSKVKYEEKWTDIFGTHTSRYFYPAIYIKKSRVSSNGNISYGDDQCYDVPQQVNSIGDFTSVRLKFN